MLTFTSKTVNDWDAVEQVWSYAFNQSLRANTSEHPVLLAEPSFNTREAREKSAEIFFEKYNVPALFICKNAVLSAYSCGRPTALVVDSGAATTSVTPVFDGYVLRNGATLCHVCASNCRSLAGIVKQTLAGNALTQLSLNLLEQQLSQKIVPSFLVAEKKVTEQGKVSAAKLRDLGKTSSSFLEYSKLHAAQDFKESVCAVSHPLPLEDSDEYGTFDVSEC